MECGSRGRIPATPLSHTKKCSNHSKRRRRSRSDLCRRTPKLGFAGLRGRQGLVFVRGMKLSVKVDVLKYWTIRLLVSAAGLATACDAKSTLEAVIVRTPHDIIETGCGGVEATELWVFSPDTKQREFILKGRGDPDATKTIANISSPIFSFDEKSIYFVSAAWAVSDSIQKVDLKTKQVEFVIDGNSVEIIPQGACKGMLLIDRSLIKYDTNGNSLGRDMYLWLVSAEGKLVREIGRTDCKEAVAFRAEHLKK